MPAADVMVTGRHADQMTDGQDKKRLVRKGRMLVFEEVKEPAPATRRAAADRRSNVGTSRARRATAKSGDARGGTGLVTRTIEADTADPPPDPEASEVTLTMVGDRPRFRSEDGTLSMWGAELDDGEYRCAVKGMLVGVPAGSRLRCEGRWEHHRTFGWTFVAVKHETL